MNSITNRPDIIIGLIRYKQLNFTIDTYEVHCTKLLFLENEEVVWDLSTKND